MLNIYGLFAYNGMPALSLLEHDITNPEHINRMELARKYWQREARQSTVYDAIVVVIGSDAAEVFTFK